MEFDPKLAYKPPANEITVQGLGYPGIWSNHGRTAIPTPTAESTEEAPALDSAESTEEAPASAP